ncbi:hypothetical protein FQN50_003743 [Emmonsiellopsis sp. PD_5]|nr:hypothetical protein FQN50_003743 [Emmonsiellopsis sp. PD_5]
MPSNNTASPTKRAVSDNHSVPPHQPSSTHGGLTHSNKVSTAAHKPHRPHVVVSHRPHMHARNPSLKNINRLQRLAAAHNFPGEGDTHVAPALRHHQRKKSAPASPSSSPRPGQNVRWNGSTVSLREHATNPGIKKNLSTPALRRNGSGILVKKNYALNKPAGQKKTVGFELVDSDEDEWEDNTSSYSPESTRRNSVVTAKMSSDNSPHSTLPATKSPLAQASSSMAGAVSQTLAAQETSSSLANGQTTEPSQEQRHLDQDDIATRILHNPHSSKVPPAISSISATAAPPAADRSPHPPSFPTLASSHIRSELSGPWTAVGTPNNPHGTSSSIEGGVSRFLMNNANVAGATSESDVTTPSSFLPHYHPNTPPSPEASSRRPASRRGQQEPPSRTQQKLWLQRTAVLTTSPPDPSMAGPSPAVPTSALEGTFMAATQSRPGSSAHMRDGRRAVIGPSGPSGTNTDSEIKRARKIYDKYATEFSVVRRFHGPIAESFQRLQSLTLPDAKANNTPQQHPSNGTTLANGNVHKTPKRATSSTADPDPTPNGQFLTKLPKSSSQVRFRTADDAAHVADSEEPAERLDVEHQHKQQRPNSVAVVSADGNVYDEQIEEEGDDNGHAGGVGGAHAGYRSYQPDEAELLLRRMWDSREVAVVGD